MDKCVKVTIMLSVLTAILLVGSSYASESAQRGWSRPYQFTEIIGSVVMNPQGQYLGRVRDLVFDHEGRVAFVVIGYGKYWRIIGENAVAVPFDSLSYNTGKKHLLLDMSWEKFREAPKFAKDELTDRRQEERIYKYFGQQPYWTEGGCPGSVDARR